MAQSKREGPAEPREAVEPAPDEIDESGRSVEVQTQPALVNIVASPATVIVVPDIDFTKATGDPLVNLRRGFGLKRLGSTGPSASVSSVSDEAAEEAAQERVPRETEEAATAG